jgi:hypothetical protein
MPPNELTAAGLELVSANCSFDVTGMTVADTREEPQAAIREFPPVFANPSVRL